MVVVFRTCTNQFIGGTGEKHPIHRANKEEFATLEKASLWVLQQCLNGKGAVSEYRIFSEHEILPVWEG